MSNSARHPAIGVATDSEDATVDDVYEALASARRRHVIATVADASAPVDVERLARAVAAAETGAEPGDAPAERVKAVHASLHHVHLPKLAHAGLVEFDADEGRVTEVADRLADFPL